MLGRSSYEKEYIDACRSQIEAQLAAYKPLAATAGDFEPLFVNALILELEMMFVHRLRTKEGKDGNPANEVRMLCHSILTTGAVMTPPDGSIKYKPATTVLKIEIGQPIKVNIEQFKTLAEAYLKEIEAKFG